MEDVVRKCSTTISTGDQSTHKLNTKLTGGLSRRS